MNSQQLENLVHKEIPITKALDIHIDELTEHSIRVIAPFEANKNIHNTAFAGSIYTVATIAGWSLVSHIASHLAIEGSVVLAKAEIQYKKPINGDIVAQCEIKDLSSLETFASSFKRKNRARINFIIDVVEDGVIKAQLNANFALVGQ
ncbi:YiiD C-terminal domain-containing protein [Kangiella geojedonensis]|uniref:Thioesterase domain protein n=1 Tax=Kangiella geojedonensis TaxID=914150 RepID=A0A0F6TRY0_9GAMM|nr:YiiD C-terminal domain-containing protein [Kangiella geojedonensis]AKE53012.1 Thioesterase domain protein [Kangiella geojedonensis]